MSASVFAALSTGITYAKSAQSTTAHALPVLSETPSDQSLDADPTAPVTITLDPSSPNFNRFRQQFVNGSFTVLVNSQPVQASYNAKTYTIALQSGRLTDNTQYTVTLLLKAEANSSQTASGNASDSFAFTTGVGPVDGTESVVAVDKKSITAGDSVTVSVTPEDQFGNRLDDDETVSVSDGSTPVQLQWNTTNSDYEGQFKETKAGTVSFTATVNGTPLSMTPTVTVSPGAPDATTSTVTVPSSVVAGPNNVVVHVVPRDLYNNLIGGQQQTVLVSDGSSAQPITATWTPAQQDYEATVTEEKAGAVNFATSVNGTPLNTETTDVSPATASKLVVKTAPSTTAGTAQDITVTALDLYDNVATGYAGTVHFTSSDAQASLPADYTFTSADAGTHTFAGGVVLKTVGSGSQTVTAIDASNSFTSQTSVAITPGAAAQIQLSPSASTVVAGQTATFTGVVTDAYGNPASIPDGTKVTFNATSGAVPSMVTTSNGQFTFELLQDIMASTDTVTASINSLTPGNSTINVTGSASAGTESYMTAGYVMNVGTAGANSWLPDYPIHNYWGTPAGWTDPSVQWIWNNPSAGNYQAAAGVTYNRHDIVLPQATNVAISVAVDNEYALYVDGQYQNGDAGWSSAQPTTLSLGAGPHTIVVLATNDASSGGNNPAGLLISATDSQGNILFDNQTGWYYTPEVPTTITLSPSALTVGAGTTDAIMGTVTDQAGNPVPDGTPVYLTSNQGSVPSTVTTSGGQFRFNLSNDSQFGTYNIYASTMNGTTASTAVTVEPGKIVYNADDWTLLDSSWNMSTKQYAQNIVNFFGGGKQGLKFYGYGSQMGSAGSASDLQAALHGMGDSYDFSSGSSLPTLSVLEGYNGVFLTPDGTVSSNDEEELIQYVNTGGNVYVGNWGDSTNDGEVQKFLNNFGLQANQPSGAGGWMPVQSTSPLLTNVPSLYVLGPDWVSTTGTSPYASVVATVSGSPYGLVGVYKWSPN